jgi:riboflavin kinase/FMN adenylyltransferase
LTIGVFDGVHLGHQALLEAVAAAGPHPTVITFSQNPKRALAPASYAGDLSSPRQKEELLCGRGIARVIPLDFSEALCNMEGSDFISLVMQAWQPRFIAVGEHFCCGRGRGMDAAVLLAWCAARGIEAQALPALRAAGGVVSSSRIREALAAGDIALAEALLGRRLEIDLRGITPRGAGPRRWAYDLSEAGLLAPAAGVYTALSAGKETRVEVEGTRILSPEPRAEKVTIVARGP